MITSLRQPILSLPKPIPIQSLMYKTTTCLTWPLTTFFVPKWKEMSKTATAKHYLAGKWEACIKSYIYSIGTLHLHLTYVFPLIVVPRALDSQSNSPRFKTTEWLPRSTHPFILLGSIKWAPGFPGAWAVKSKLSPSNGSIALRQLNHVHKKGPYSFKFFRIR